MMELPLLCLPTFWNQVRDFAFSAYFGHFSTFPTRLLRHLVRGWQIKAGGYLSWSGYYISYSPTALLQQCRKHFINDERGSNAKIIVETILLITAMSTELPCRRRCQEAFTGRSFRRIPGSSSFPHPYRKLRIIWETSTFSNIVSWFLIDLCRRHHS